MGRKVAFVTNVTQYAGAPAAAALANAGWDVWCHDERFVSVEARAAYEREHSGCYASSSQEAGTFVSEGLGRFGRIDALISNDIPRSLGTAFDAAAFGAAAADRLDHFEIFLDSLVLEPVRLLRAALPAMKSARTGSILLITSGAPLRSPPMDGPHGYIAARGAANVLAKSLAAELAPSGIQVNALAPFLLYSETFFPSDMGPSDPKFQGLIERLVPMNRFGSPEEIGTLIANLVSGAMSFVSGQVIAFSGAGC